MLFFAEMESDEEEDDWGDVPDAFTELLGKATTSAAATPAAPTPAATPAAAGAFASPGSFDFSLDDDEPAAPAHVAAHCG